MNRYECCIGNRLGLPGCGGPISPACEAARQLAQPMPEHCNPNCVDNPVTPANECDQVVEPMGLGTLQCDCADPDDKYKGVCVVPNKSGILCKITPPAVPATSLLAMTNVTRIEIVQSFGPQVTVRALNVTEPPPPSPTPPQGVVIPTKVMQFDRSPGPATPALATEFIVDAPLPPQGVSNHALRVSATGPTGLPLWTTNDASFGVGIFTKGGGGCSCGK